MGVIGAGGAVMAVTGHRRVERLRAELALRPYADRDQRGLALTARF